MERLSAFSLVDSYSPDGPYSLHTLTRRLAVDELRLQPKVAEAIKKRFVRFWLEGVRQLRGQNESISTVFKLLEAQVPNLEAAISLLFELHDAALARDDEEITRMLSTLVDELSNVIGFRTYVDENRLSQWAYQTLLDLIVAGRIDIYTYLIPLRRALMPRALTGSDERTVKLGNTTLDLTRPRDFHVGNRLYQGRDIVPIHSAVRQALADRLLVQGIHSVYSDLAVRIQNFLSEHLGTSEFSVPFGGRAVELASLDKWLEDDGPPYLLLTAPAGRGKSALLVHWSQQLLARQDVAIVFIPVSIRFRTNSSRNVFAVLATHLATLHRDKVPSILDTSVEMLRSLIAEDMCRPLPDGRRLLVILDGVDEGSDWHIDPSLFPLVPPRGLRVVVSTRPLIGDADGRDLLRRLGWDRAGQASVMALDRLTHDGVAEVLRQTAYSITNPRPTRLWLMSFTASVKVIHC